MPMPKLDDVFPHLDPKKADHELMAYAEACYAAGKADALPQWPPEEGKVFVIGKGLNFCGQVMGRWNGTNWDRRLDIPGEKWFSDEPSDGITAAYLLGELEEVE